MKKFYCFIISIVLVSLFCNSYGQDSLIQSVSNTPPSPSKSNESLVLPMTNLEFTLSVIVLTFGLTVVLLELVLIKYRKINSEDSIKFIIVTLIITGTLFLITAGYSNDQIAPATGLLGTIAGYLLGKAHSTKTDKSHEDD